MQISYRQVAPSRIDLAGWIAGKIGPFKFTALVFSGPSDFGINHGRISKLQLRIGDSVACNFDRGWDVRPQSPIAAEAVDCIRRTFPA